MSQLMIVQNFNFHGEICRKSALSWSADNKIAICTNAGIYILSSYCSPVETGFPLPLHKQIIPAPEKHLDFGLFSEFKKIKFGMHCPEPYYEIFMDHTLIAPKEPQYLSYKTALWSQKNANSDGSCFLATLTVDHRLVLHQEKDREWETVCDISLILYEIRKSSWSESNYFVENDTTAEETVAEEDNENAEDADDEEEMEENADDNVSDVDDNKDETDSDYVAEEVTEDDEDFDPDDMEEEEENFKNSSRSRKSGNGNKIDAIVPFSKEQLKDVRLKKSQAYDLAIMEIAWTSVFTSVSSSVNDMGNKWCYLLTALKNGHVIWWKISPDDSKMVSLAYEWNPNIGLITCMRWQQTSHHSGFLIVGTLSGLVTFSSVNIKFEGSEPRVDIKPLCKLWEECDQIVVDHLAVMKVSVKKHIIVATKQNFIISCDVTFTDSDTVIKNVGHSCGLHTLPVTGLSAVQGSIPQTQLLLSSMDGLVVSVKIHTGQNAIEFSHEALDLDVDVKHNTIQGLGVSPNGLLGAVVLNTSVYYDHLIKKDPLQFVMFVIKPLDEIFSDFGRVLKPQFSFLPASANSICRYTDYMECVRIHLASSETVPNLFVDLIGWTVESYERLSAVELYFLRFLLKSFLSELAISVPFDKEDLCHKLEVIETVIMQNYISKVISSCHDKIDLLSPVQGQSLLLMADWLYMQFETPVSNLYEAFGYDCPPDTSSIPARETCRICQLPVKLEDIRYGECEQKHKFGRCCQSLILCDVTPYYQCLSCKSMALEDVWSNKFICTYCSLPMTR